MLKRDEEDYKHKLDFGDYHLNRASHWRSQWGFISDEIMKRNIAYQLQYLDFLISLYNSYSPYATVKSLIIKNLIVNVNLIIEAVLSYSVEYLEKEEDNKTPEEQDSYSVLLGKAYHGHKLISKELWHTLHELRKQGNSRHFQSEEEWELNKYKIENANDAIDILEEVREELSDYFSKLPE